MTVLGAVDIRAFDVGCYLTLGAELIEFTIDGDVRRQYVVDIPQINSDIPRFQNKIPVFFDSPEDPYQDFILPSFCFKQNDYTPAFERQPYTGVVARGPAKDAEKIILPDGREGWSKYETQFRGDPYDMTYDLSIYARRKMELNYMVQYVMKMMKPPWFAFKVIDSLGDVRHYDAGEMTFSNTSELADIANRTQSWVVTFTVRGEIDTFETEESPAMLVPTTRIRHMEG